jgi:hypothetical protein
MMLFGLFGRKDNDAMLMIQRQSDRFIRNVYRIVAVILAPGMIFVSFFWRFGAELRSALYFAWSDARLEASIYFQMLRYGKSPEEAIKAIGDQQ